MKKVFCFNSCTTCRKMLSELNLTGFEFVDIKKHGINVTDLEKMHALAGSYEALFSKKSTQIKLRNIDVKTLTETNFKELILSHYSFLKRPVIVDEQNIYIGSDPKNKEKVKEVFGKTEN